MKKNVLLFALILSVQGVASAASVCDGDTCIQVPSAAKVAAEIREGAAVPLDVVCDGDTCVKAPSIRAFDMEKDVVSANHAVIKGIKKKPY